MHAIFKKEMRTYFTTMTGYIFLGFFLLITAYFFAAINIVSGSASYTTTLSSTLSMFLILIPIMTMRLFAEETRQKTDQLLFTSPISIVKIVFGKFFAAAGLFTIGVLITLIFPIILSFYGEIAWAETLGAFVGYLFLGYGLISVGVFVSVLTDNQIIAAVGTFAALFFILMMNGIASTLPVETSYSVAFVVVVVCIAAFIVYNSTRNAYAGGIIALLGCAAVAAVYILNPLIFDGAMVKILGWFSVLNRFQSFFMGVFSIGDLVYFITFSLAFLYLTINVIEKRRWR